MTTKQQHAHDHCIFHVVHVTLIVAKEEGQYVGCGLSVTTASTEAQFKTETKKDIPS